MGEAGFKGLANGELIRQAIEVGFQVLLTADRGLPMQQNIGASGIAVVLVPGSRMGELEPRASEIESAVSQAEPGTVVRLERR